MSYSSLEREIRQNAFRGCCDTWEILSAVSIGLHITLSQNYHRLDDAPDTFTNANGCLGLSMYAADTSDLGKEGSFSEFYLYP